MCCLRAQSSHAVSGLQANFGKVGQPIIQSKSEKMSDVEMREMFKLFDIEGKVGCSPVSGVKEKVKL